MQADPFAQYEQRKFGTGVLNQLACGTINIGASGDLSWQEC